MTFEPQPLEPYGVGASEVLSQPHRSLGTMALLEVPPHVRGFAEKVGNKDHDRGNEYALDFLLFDRGVVDEFKIALALTDRGQKEQLRSFLDSLLRKDGVEPMFDRFPLGGLVGSMLDQGGESAKFEIVSAESSILQASVKNVTVADENGSSGRPALICTLEGVRSETIE